MESNSKIRKLARSAGVPLWRIADRLGISEPTLTRWLRKPLPKEKEAQIMNVIQILELELEQEG